MHEEDVAANQSMGRFGAELIPDGSTILTHCNAGALATAGYGTALGVIRALVESGKDVAVFADETRPFLQGARLTAWELQKEGIPVTLITDSMAGHFMNRGKISCVIVGADRIAANGDVANKIGTYSVAVLARENHLPFYVAAPISTLDLSLESGAQIPIEERHEEEVSHVKGQQLAPTGVRIANPAFDVTPNRYVTAIITERGVARPDYRDSLRYLADLTR
jgi:methylthioribose-1-phosphate isomerase